MKNNCERKWYEPSLMGMIYIDGLGTALITTAICQNFFTRPVTLTLGLLGFIPGAVLAIYSFKKDKPQAPSKED